MERLTKRADYVAAAKGRRVEREGFVLQARRRAAADAESVTGQARFGLTVTKRIGNSVTRNRARRRLREALRLCDASRALAGTDYVLLARPGALSLPFERLIGDIETSIAHIAQALQAPRKPSRPQPTASGA
jgi:ribonuclease P protein component